MFISKKGGLGWGSSKASVFSCPTGTCVGKVVDSCSESIRGRTRMNGRGAMEKHVSAQCEK